jgi:CheY-like chemotaxis protein
MEADRTIIDSLDYTRSLVAELAPPALHEFGLLEGFGWLAEQMKNHGLTVTVTKNIHNVVLDADQAVLVFQSTRELLFNVLKHAGTNQAALTIDRNSDGHLVVTVKDEGRGFDPDDMLARNDERKRFGLFSVRERTEAMGGRLELTSMSNQGTCAALIVPYWPVAPDPVASPDSPLSPARSKGAASVRSSQPGDQDGRSIREADDSAQGGVLRVLLADDHAMVRQGLRSILDSYPDISIVGEAADGEEAVELAGQLAPDVIVMDVNMPKLDGIEATRRIKARWPGITIVGLSVSTAAQVESLLLEAGASCYVSKEAAGIHLYGAILTTVPQDSADCRMGKRGIVLPAGEAPP